MYKFCSKEIKGIHYIFVPKEEVESNEANLIQRFKTSEEVPETRSYYKFVPQNLNTIWCYIHSKSDNYRDHRVSVMLYFETTSSKENDIVVCIFNHNWWNGVNQMCEVLKTLTR